MYNPILDTVCSIQNFPVSVLQSAIVELSCYEPEDRERKNNKIKGKRVSTSSEEGSLNFNGLSDLGRRMLSCS